MIFTLTDRNLYYEGKVIGRILSVRDDKDGIAFEARVTDAEAKRLLGSSRERVFFSVPIKEI